ncbi:hypothetical protein LTR70_008407 [Exophiala xenobiotica]|uniref:WKF domain-containing protein n=1 Tax=Lithohypha guttulata TaxID=1690604 RepID=A0ABR0KE53_9EURO|nr:hypothetical protein LTR24_003824 [Lithohypha guttulata]KAK5312054.1 hypothetical protein LTR70_008407 [Exophiala xenobiotica]
MTSHVPAWKRLGLKLKNANEQPENVVDSQKDRTLAGTKAHDTSSDLFERPAKRQRLDDSPKINASSTPDHARAKSERYSSGRRNGQHSVETDDTPKSGKQATKRRKSVTFTDDTKVEDGDSRVTIDFPAGSPGQTPQKARISKAGTDSPDATGSPSPAAFGADEAAPVRKKKKAKTGKKTQGNQRQSKDKSDPALEYLHQHRYHHDSWKFNKNREVWIVNRALNTETIPNTHVLALAGYVRGLPESAGARARLVKECREALADGGLEADSNDQGKLRTLSILESKSDEAEVQPFLETHSRPAILLWALGESTQSGSKSTASTATNSHTSSEAPRKRKTRTSAPIDVSSSSEDDSSDSTSDSDADESLKSKTNGMKDKTNGTSTIADDTSSSGSSSPEDGDQDDTSSSGTSNDSH